MNSPRLTQDSPRTTGELYLSVGKKTAEEHLVVSCLYNSNCSHSLGDCSARYAITLCTDYDITLQPRKTLVPVVKLRVSHCALVVDKSEWRFPDWAVREQNALGQIQSWCSWRRVSRRVPRLHSRKQSPTVHLSGLETKSRTSHTEITP